MIVSRVAAAGVLAAQARTEREAATWQRYAARELSLDLNGMRGRLAAKGLVYADEPPGEAS